MSLYMKQRLLQIFSVLLGVFGLAFGITWQAHGFCLGDWILNGLGLPAWSDGTQGTHYAAVAGAAMLLASFFLFAAVTPKQSRAARLYKLGFIAVVLAVYVLSLLV